jgi:phosphatidylglycerophosphate synthase
MLDRLALSLARPLLDRCAASIVRRGFSADQVTFAALAVGLAGSLLIGLGQSWLALIPLLIGRCLDGLDGAVARLSNSTDRGAFLDISLDFLFYASVPLAFAVQSPAENALAAAVLLAAFVATGTTFLAYAVLAEKRHLKSTAYPSKSFYYLGGLTEGTETIICFVVMCLWPQHFAVFAYVYAAMCAVTTVTRLVAGWEAFRS